MPAEQPDPKQGPHHNAEQLPQGRFRPLLVQGSGYLDIAIGSKQTVQKSDTQCVPGEASPL